MTKVLLCGANGHMGRVIHSVIAGREDLQVVAGIDLNDRVYADFPIYRKPSEFTGEADVIVDFSHPSLLDDLLELALTRQIPLVLATTGYSEEQLAKIRAAAEKVAVFFTFNMSLGVNLLQELAARAAVVLGGQFDIEIIEKHHNQKLDAPSGTAIMLANSVNAAAGEQYYYAYDRHSKRQRRNAREIGIHSVRGGSIVGEHEVLFAGRDEQISLKHTATSKEVFGVGAVNAAAFLAGKPAGLYDMAALLQQEG